MHNMCPPPGPVAGVSDIVAPVANWATCMIMPWVHHYCHIACIASYLMGQGFDYPTALAMAQDMMRQHMGPGMMPGMGPAMGPGMMPGMGPAMGPGMMPGMGPTAPGMEMNPPGMGPGISPANLPPLPGMATGMPW